MGDWTVRVAVRTRKGIIMTKNVGQDKWHLLGGKKEAVDRDWRCTAVREAFEEAQLCLPRERLARHETSHNKRGKKGRYSLHYCSIDLPVLCVKGIPTKGPEDEEIRVFSYKELRRMLQANEVGPRDTGYLRRRKLLRKPHART